MKETEIGLRERERERKKKKRINWTMSSRNMNNEEEYRSGLCREAEEITEGTKRQSLEKMCCSANLQHRNKINVH